MAKRHRHRRRAAQRARADALRSSTGGTTFSRRNANTVSSASGSIGGSTGGSTRGGTSLGSTGGGNALAGAPGSGSRVDALTELIRGTRES